MKRENISYQNSEYNVQKDVLCINKPMTLERENISYQNSEYNVLCPLYCCGL